MSSCHPRTVHSKNPDEFVIWKRLKLAKHLVGNLTKLSVGTKQEKNHLGLIIMHIS